MLYLIIIITEFLTMIHSINIGLSTSGVKDPLYKKLLQTHQIVEMNLSSIGIEDRRTKELYRDSQKNKAFEMMQTMVDSLNLHQSVLVKGFF